MSGQALIVQGDALHLPLPDASVDLVVTSPPYFALRAYGAGPSEIGSEPTPAEYLEALWAATAEMMRVLKPTGSAFIDLGDKYSAYGGAHKGHGRDLEGHSRDDRRGGSQALGYRDPDRWGTPAKSLLLLPERYRIGCVDRLGLIARAVLVWNKPNGLPESVTDRVRRSHEDWVHLVKQPRYYSATDEVREPHAPASLKRYEAPFAASSTSAGAHRPSVNADYSGQIDANPLGKLPGSVWTIPSEPLRLPEHLGVQHYAAFPSEWPRRLILGWSPPGICLECGQGRVPVTESRYVPARARGGDGSINRTRKAQILPGDEVPRSSMDREVLDKDTTILGYACSCTPFTDHPGSGEDNGQHGGIGNNVDGRYPDVGISSPAGGTGHLGNRPKVGPWREYHLDGWKAPPTRPAVVCDPFMGTGTVLGVARQLGRIGVGTDLSFPYCRAARYRVFQSGDFGKAESRTWRDRQGSLL